MDMKLHGDFCLRPRGSLPPPVLVFLRAHPSERAWVSLGCGALDDLRGPT